VCRRVSPDPVRANPQPLATAGDQPARQTARDRGTGRKFWVGRQDGMGATGSGSRYAKHARKSCKRGAARKPYKMCCNTPGNVQNQAQYVVIRHHKNSIVGKAGAGRPSSRFN